MRRARWALLPVAVLAAAGCGQSVQGTPAPNSQAAAAAADRMFETGLLALKAYVDQKEEFRGTVFRYAVIGGEPAGDEIDVSRFGKPAAVIVRIRSAAHKGYDYDIFNPPKSPVDYVRLGPGYARLEPTPWVSTPTVYSSGFSCAITGFQTLCKVSAAINATARATPPGLVTTATRLADGGTEVVTAVTLKSFLDAGIIPIPTRVADKINPDVTGSLVPVRLTLNSDGTFRKVEFDGEVVGKGTDIKLQVGFEDKGRPGGQDFPPVPPPPEVTVLDKAGSDDFWARLNAVPFQ